jgi:hypothetical protein
MKTVIVVFPGGFSRNKDGLWHSAHFGEKAEAGPTGSYVRIAAAAILAKANPATTVVVSGGRGTADKILPPGLFLSAIMKKELVTQGVNGDRIFEESKSGTTYQQLLAIAELFAKHHWESIQLVSNHYHLPRIRSMIENFPELAPLRSIVQYVSAEEVVLGEDPGVWQAAIDKAYDSEDFKKIISLEKKGVEDIMAGTYKHVDVN